MSWLLLILWILLYFLLFIFSFILLVLVFPLTLSVTSKVDGLDYEGKFSFDVIMGLIGGTIFFSPEENIFKLRLASIPVYSTDLKEAEKEPEKKPEEKPEELSRSRDYRTSINLLGPLKRLIKSVVGRIKLRRFDLNVKSGLSDPYTSGMIFGVIFPVIEIIKLCFPVASISIIPVFIEERFSALLDSAINMRLILFVVPVLRFFFSKEFRAYRRFGR